LTEVGDRVVLFPGADKPHVVRLSAGENVNGARVACRLVGECYLHGAMDAQLQPGTPEKTFVLE
jgi:hypothetical protein